MTSGSSSGWLQGDVLAEAFELVDDVTQRRGRRCDGIRA